MEYFKKVYVVLITYFCRELGVEDPKEFVDQLRGIRNTTSVEVLSKGIEFRIEDKSIVVEVDDKTRKELTQILCDFFSVDFKTSGISKLVNGTVAKYKNLEIIS
jgi:hypothetical protein